MSKLSETYKGWKESGMSGRGNTDTMIHAIVEELLQKESPKSVSEVTEEKPKKR